MGVPKRLTEMQQKFANELISNEGRKYAYQCAIDAGYEKDRARVTASELMNPNKYPLVVKYLGELREEYQKKYAVTFERHISELGKIRQDALKKGAWSAAVNAEVARGKAAGLYVEQKIIKTGKLEDLTTEQLEDKMRNIMKDYSSIINVTPEPEEIKEPKKKQIKLKSNKQEDKKETQPVKPLKSTTEPEIKNPSKTNSA